MPLFNNLKSFRELHNISQSQLGQLVGVSRQTISSIERGDYHPSIVVALKIASIFGTTVENLFKYTEDI